MFNSCSLILYFSSYGDVAVKKISIKFFDEQVFKICAV